MGFFFCMKREGDEKGTAEPPSLHTKFHFEFHSLKEETLFIATPQSHFVRQLPGWGAFWGTLCAKIYELTLRLEQGRLTHCRSQFSLFLPVLRFASSATGGAQLRTSKREPFGALYTLPQKLSPFTGKVDTNECEWPKGEVGFALEKDGRSWLSAPIFPESLTHGAGELIMQSGGNAAKLFIL